MSMNMALNDEEKFVLEVNQYVLSMLLVIFNQLKSGEGIYFNINKANGLTGIYIFSKCASPTN